MKFKTKLILVALIPMILVGIAVTLVSLWFSQRFLSREQEQLLKLALDGYTVGEPLDVYKEDNIELVLFQDNNSIDSSIENVDTIKLDESVIENLKDDGEYYTKNVDIGKREYYCYYKQVDGGVLLASKEMKPVLRNITNMLLFMIVMAVILMVVISILALVIANHMVKRIQVISQYIRKIADGDLKNRIEIGDSFNNDEIGDIYKNTDRLFRKLSDVLKATTDINNDVNLSSNDLKNYSSTTLAAINEVSKAVEEITIGLQNQAEEVSNISVNVQGIHSDIDSIKLLSDEIADSSNNLSKSGNIMTEKMQDMSKSNDEVSLNISDISNRMLSMSEIVEKVEGIASVIGDISSQTKLLSLNASIEAARAGEAGRGFAVVAGSISELSENTSAQVTEITGIVTTLVKDFQDCIKMMELVSKNGDIQKDSISNVMKEFDVLLKEIDETSSRVTSIKTSIDKAVDEVSSITNEISTLTGISENSAASTEEVNASIEEINALINNVSENASQLNKEAASLKDKLEYFDI